MRKEPLKYLTKEDLIGIIKTNPETKRLAQMRLIITVHKRIDDIINKQAKCDMTTPDGLARYVELEAEYKKWTRIQEQL